MPADTVGLSTRSPWRLTCHTCLTRPLSVVRDVTRNQAEKGTTCPVCTQHVKVYKRPLNSGMARSLIAIYVVAGRDWCHIPTQIGARSREEGKLAYWGLLEESPVPRDDGGKAGWWQITAKGEAFVQQQIKVPSHARVYNGRVLDLRGNPISIVDALGKKFNYNELMGI